MIFNLASLISHIGWRKKKKQKKKRAPHTKMQYVAAIKLRLQLPEDAIILHNLS